MTISSCAFCKLIFRTTRLLIRMSWLGRNFVWKVLNTKILWNPSLELQYIEAWQVLGNLESLLY